MATTDLAVLGLEVRSDGVVVASNRLKELEQSSKGAETATGGLARSTSMLTKAVVALGVAYAGYKLASFIKDSALLGARFETLGITMITAGKNAGYSAGQMEYFEKSLRAAGISMIESRAVLTSMAAANLDLSKSYEIARAAQNLAVAADIDSSEAFARFVHGIKSGEQEVLKTMGLQVQWEAGYKKLAAELGKTSTALTEQEKLLSRTNTALNAAKGYASLYEQAMGTAGKQLRSLNRYYQDLKVNLGASFQPFMVKFVESLTGAVKSLDKAVSDRAFKKSLESVGATLGEIVKNMAEVVKYAGLRSIMGTAATGAELIGQGLLDSDKFYKASFLQRQRMVDAVMRDRDIIMGPTATGKIGPTGLEFEVEEPSSAKAKSAAPEIDAKMAKKLKEQAAVREYERYVSSLEQAEDEEYLRLERLGAAYQENKASAHALFVEEKRFNDELAEAREARLDREDKANRTFFDGWSSGLDRYINETQDTFSQAERFATSTAQAMEGAFSDFFFDVLSNKLQSFGDYVNSFLASMNRATAGYVSSAFVGGAMAGAKAYFGGSGGGDWDGTLENQPSELESAKGNVFSDGALIPFARGGVVNRPTTFPMRGIMAEAGPEAIMPLSRDSSGNLGVKSDGGGTTNIYFQVQAIDAASFRSSLAQNRETIVSIVADGHRRAGKRVAIQ